MIIRSEPRPEQPNWSAFSTGAGVGFGVFEAEAFCEFKLAARGVKERGPASRGRGVQGLCEAVERVRKDGYSKVLCC